MDYQVPTDIVLYNRVELNKKNFFNYRPICPSLCVNHHVALKVYAGIKWLIEMLANYKAVLRHGLIVQAYVYVDRHVTVE